MKIKYWRQLKDLTSLEINELYGISDKYLHVIFPDGDWEVWSTEHLFGESLTEYMLEWYIKDIEKPTLPFTEVLKS